MYFDVNPKTSQQDLFGMSYLVESTINYLNDKTVRMIVLKGLRRTGKTSLLNVALSGVKGKSVKIDVRESPYDDRREFMRFLVEKIKMEVGEPFFQKILKRFSGLKLAYKDLSATFLFQSEKDFPLFFEKLNRQLEESKTSLVIAFDEAQLLSQIKFENNLAAIYDNYKNIRIIITGSEVGLVDDFLGKKNVDAALFGRAYIEVETKKFGGEQIGDFLAEGGKQIGKSITLKESREVIEFLDGVIGWATHYGWLRSKNLPHEKALEKVLADGSEIAKRELENFLIRRRKTNYTHLLKWIKKGFNRWGMIKGQYAKNGMKTSDYQLNFYLKELIDYGIIEKINESYFITDPLFGRVVSEKF